MSDNHLRWSRILGALPELVRGCRVGIAANALQAEEKHRQQIGSAIGYLLQFHLEGRDGWFPGAWVDGVLPAALELSEAGILSVHGLAAWSGNGGWSLDPLAARIELSSDGGTVVAYSLCFGDAETGLGRFPYKPYSKDLYRKLPTAWRFVFDHGDARRAISPA